YLLSISRKDLYDEVWSVGMTKAAKKLDIPYHNLKKACVDYGIPLSTQSYWSQLYMANEKPSQPTLTNAEDSAVNTTKKSKNNQAKTTPSKIVESTQHKVKQETPALRTSGRKLPVEDKRYISENKHEESRLIDIYTNLKIN